MATWIGEGGIATSLENLFGHKLERLMDEPGLLVMGEYQPGPDIVDPITRGQRTYSLFTSGVQGASAPSAMIDGSSITADLSSLYFADSRGDSFTARNIGGIAKGIFNPDTLEFYLTWDHLLGDRPKSGLATFSLYGKVNMVDVAAVPLATTAVLFGTGLAVLMTVWRRKGTTQRGNMVQSGVVWSIRSVWSSRLFGSTNEREKADPRTRQTGLTPVHRLAFLDTWA